MNRWHAAGLVVGLIYAVPITTWVPIAVSAAPIAVSAAPIAASAAPIAASRQPTLLRADGFRVAQSEPRAKRPRGRAQPQLDEEDQLSPRQLDQRAPARPMRPAEPPDQPAPAPPQRSAEPPRAIVCNGVFGKDSSHLKLATRFDSRNLTFAEVDGPEGSRLMASVLFPNDPRRRLEVLWQNEAARTDTHLIVINGQSTWMAPKGLRLGLALAALEKFNGKPFKLSGFDQPNGGAVSDWQGGVLENLPGGCRLGIRLVPDAKAAEAARNEVLGKEFMSSDAKMRAVRPIIAEIIIGY
jgi:hypothetical protein